MDCICLMAGKLVRFVPIFELEDSLLCPLLGAMVEYLKEPDTGDRGGEQDGVLLLGLHSGGAERECGEALNAAGVRGWGGAQPDQCVAQDAYQHLLLPAGLGGDLHFLLGYQKHTGRSLRSCPSV